MVTKVLSIGVMGIDGYKVEVEVDIRRGLPSFSIVGLPDSAVKESKERVRAALGNSGFEFPSGKIVVNLSPADVKKEGASFDLPIAIGILSASGLFSQDALNNLYILGELSLDGRVKRIKGALSASSYLKGKNHRGLVLPSISAREASIIKEVCIFPVERLVDVVMFLKGEKVIPRQRPINFTHSFTYSVDFSEVKGQERIKRAVEVAAAGGHNLLMIGPPGAGKTMIAKRIPTILPPLSTEEIIETTMIYSVSGLLGDDKPFMTERPFVSPHHTASDIGIIGGGQVPKPGAVSLAHNGILFLDEFPEFKRSVIEALRQPMEEGKVTVTRSAMTVSFPSRFMLVAACNPCPCGYYGFEGKKTCTCTYSQIKKYQSKLSGPIMDRIDIHLEVPPLEVDELLEEGSGEPSHEIRKRVERARRIQEERFKKQDIKLNAHMSGKMVKKFCKIGPKEKSILGSAIEKLGLSARSFNKILKVARTIADLEGKDSIKPSHISEAIHYRVLDRFYG